MGRIVVEDQMLLKSDGKEDALELHGDTIGHGSDGDPCVTAATDSMAEAAMWVYLPLEDAVAEIIDNKDDVPVDEMAARIRAAIERGIEKGREIRRKDGRE